MLGFKYTTFYLFYICKSAFIPLLLLSCLVLYHTIIIPLSPLFTFKTASLRYNEHTMQFTHIKYTIQWLLVYSNSCPSSTAINFATFSLPQKEIHTPWPSPSNPSYSPALGNH